MMQVLIHISMPRTSFFICCDELLNLII